jgi:hypothetical protein
MYLKFEELWQLHQYWQVGGPIKILWRFQTFVNFPFNFHFPLGTQRTCRSYEKISTLPNWTGNEDPVEEKMKTKLEQKSTRVQVLFELVKIYQREIIQWCVFKSKKDENLFENFERKQLKMEFFLQFCLRTLKNFWENKWIETLGVETSKILHQKDVQFLPLYLSSISDFQDM